MDSLNLLPISQSLIDVGLSNGNLLFILSLVLGKLGTFEVRLDSQPQLPPEPGLTNVVVANGSLQTIQRQFLVLQLLEDKTRSFSSGLSLQPGQYTTNTVFTNLFHVT